MVRLMACHGAANLLYWMGVGGLIFIRTMALESLSCTVVHAQWIPFSAVGSLSFTVVFYLLHSFGLAFPLWLLRAGSGYRVPTVCRRHAREPVRAFNGYLVFTKPESECYGARRTSWLLKCPFWMSSTHWGRRATVCAERTVSGCIWATGVTSECGRMRLLSSLGKEEIKAKSSNRFQEHKCSHCRFPAVCAYVVFSVLSPYADASIGAR